jgi:uncharacterized lipoprotein YddW (UPF0748 family)
MKPCVLFAVLLLSLQALPLQAQEAAPKHEFRGTWISTVLNLDWPLSSTATPATQRTQLITKLDALKEAGINAVIFQIRPEQDTFYASDTEPWSRWLTGQQGKAPNPFYDPLQFAIDEARKRGMELHAWFNPYRSERVVGNYPLHAKHIAVRHPEWHFTVGSYKQLDPGLPQVRDYVVSVVMDVVRRYDIDGVHFDDYFYPYPPNAITDQDDATFAAHTRGFTDQGDWRRDNVNLLIEVLGDSIRAEKPHVKFGISPFGIWKYGVPAGITGMDAYSVIFADAVTWLQNRWLDYINPQLYWKFGGNQDYERLANWWASQRNERHFYSGMAAYKSDGSTFWNPDDYAANEVPRQLRFNRAHAGIHGGVLFRSSNLTRFHSKGLADSLRTRINTRPAIVPPMPWKSMEAPGRPANLAVSQPEDGAEVHLSWAAPAPGGAQAMRYAVYRVPRATAIVGDALASAEYLIAVTGLTTLTDTPPGEASGYDYHVTALSRNNVESVSAMGQISISAPFTGSRGWRMLTVPVAGVTVADLAGQNLVQGVPPFYPEAQPNLYTGYGPTGWTAAAGGGEELVPGRGFIWYLWEEPGAQQGASVNIGLPFTLSLSGPSGSSTVAVPLDGPDDHPRWKLVGNPFPWATDISDIGAWASGGALASAVAQRWDPDGGTFRLSTETDGVIDAWTGFFIENDDATSLAMPAAARAGAGAGKTSGDGFRRGRIAFELEGRTPDGEPRLDRAAVLYLDERAADGWDAWDASKLTPLEGRYASLAFTDGDSAGARLKAQESRPWPVEDLEVAMVADSHGIEDRLVLRWPHIDVPPDWSIRLTDAASGETVDLRAADEYVFDQASSPLPPGKTEAADGIPAPWQAATMRSAPADARSFTLRIDLRGSLAESDPFPADNGFRLEAIYPNPAPGPVTVAYVLPEEAPVTLAVYDMLGRRVATLVEGVGKPGRRTVTWGGGDARSGVYFVRLQSPVGRDTRMVVVIGS